MNKFRWQTLAAQAIRMVLETRARRRGRFTRLGRRERLLEGALRHAEKRLNRMGRTPAQRRQ